MIRRRKHQQQDPDELRAKFVANREKVRSFITGWACPEVEWPAFAEIPLPCMVPKGQEQEWLKRRAPFVGEYHWLLQARPLVADIRSLWAHWNFAEGHEFQLLEIEVQSVPDPGYLAEKLTLGAHAAALKGWRPGDAHELHAWLFEGLDSRPLDDGVRGQKRTGFILFKLLRFPVAGANEISAKLSMTLTDTALDGSPLDAGGETPAP